MSRSAPGGVSVATKTKYKGGWLDKDLRAANGRVGLSAKAKPYQFSPTWSYRAAPILDEDGWMVSRTGTHKFQVCTNCHVWTGAMIRLEYLEDGTVVEQHSAPLYLRHCDCTKVGGLSLIDPVAIDELALPPMVLMVFERAGINNTHEADEVGHRGLVEIPGIGRHSVMILRAALRAAGLPDLRAGAAA